MSQVRGLIVAVVSVKGGIGKSLLATNLGAVAAAHHNLTAITVDLNAGTGVDDLLLDLRPEKNWGHLLPVLHEVTIEHLELAWTRHSSGLRLLSAPPDFHALSPLDGPRTVSLLEIMRKSCQLVIVDCPTGYDALARAVLSKADLTFCLVTSDPLCLRTTQRMFASMTDVQSIQLVISQYEEGSALTPAEVGDILMRPVIGMLPIDARAVWENVNFGQPCGLSRKRGLGGEYRRLAKGIADSLGGGVSPVAH